MSRHRNRSSSRISGSGGGSGIDLIYDEDLANVNNNIFLGNAGESDEGLSTGPLGSKMPSDSQATIPQGYIDDAIVQDVINSTDERLHKKKKSMKKVVVGIIGASAILAIIIGSSPLVGEESFKKERVKEIINDRSTAFHFDDRDEYVKPTVSETTEAGRIDLGATEANTNEAEMTTGTGMTTGTSGILETEIPIAVKIETGTTIERSSILETEILLESEAVFPSAIENFLVDTRLKFDNKHETPLFWQVPFAGGPFQNSMTACSKKVLASNHRETDDNTLKIHNVGASPYVNVDLSTTEGIENAAMQGLAESGLADVIVSNHVHFTTGHIFDAGHKGRLFTALRHPVDRCIAEYHYVMATTNDPNVQSLSLLEFASSPHMDKDWMTRFLINKRQVGLVQEDLQLAKEILRRRCLVGLHERIKLSIKLFEQYFGWTVKGKSITKAHKKCLQTVISRENNRAMDVYHDVGDVKKGSAAYNKIAKLNKFDMELYWYAYDLFEEQQAWVEASREGL